MSGSPPTVHLIDASPYMFRAHFSLPDSIRDGEGRTVSATYGFTSFLVKYLGEEHPTHIGVTFDRHFNHSFRNRFYPQYKAQRSASPPELEAQIDLCVDVASALGMATFIDPEFEADDLIATIIDQTRESRARYVIVSPDKDLSQLVNDRTVVVDPARSIRFDATAVEEKFGVRPEQIPDFLGLAGDSVDNIPGVAGIGPKGAAQLLRRYGSIEGIYQNLEAMKTSGVRGAGSTAAKLERSVSMAGLSKSLATVSTDAPIRVTLRDLSFTGPDEDRLRELFGRLGFKTLLVRAAKK